MSESEDCKRRLAEQKRKIDALTEELRLVRKAARWIYDRRTFASGSLEMAECDAVCKDAWLRVWEWPL